MSFGVAVIHRRLVRAKPVETIARGDIGMGYGIVRGRGFTLVEAMVAVGLVGMIGVAASGLMLQLSEARGRADRVSSYTAEANYALHAMGMAIRNCYRPQDEQVSVLFEGLDETLDGRPADRLRLQVVSHAVVRNGEPESDVREIEFSVDSVVRGEAPMLMRRIDPTLNELPDGGGVVDRVAKGVVSLDIEYFNGVTWEPEWPVILGAVPEAVRIKLGIMKDKDAEVMKVASYSMLVRTARFDSKRSE